MHLRFITPQTSDQRIDYAAKFLEKNGLERVGKEENADFILLGVNPDTQYLSSSLPIFAGNVKGDGIWDYTKNEAFQMKNAFLTAEAALALAIKESRCSLNGAKVLIVGYGRIGKALHRFLAPFTGGITVCARSEVQRTEAIFCGAETIDFSGLKSCGAYRYIFNTVPHPVFMKEELKCISKNAVLMELASFPGGIDLHFARYYGLQVITARGLPGAYMPETAGAVLGEALLEMLRETPFSKTKEVKACASDLP